jgi:hypothetical protein
MTPVGIQRRRAALRVAGRRRPGGPGWSGVDATPRLFAEGGTPAPVEARVGAREAPAVEAARSEPGRRGEGATLEELVARLWEEVLTEGGAVCPLCGGDLMGRASAHARATEGRCRDCGTTIA